MSGDRQAWHSKPCAVRGVLAFEVLRLMPSTLTNHRVSQVLRIVRRAGRTQLRTSHDRFRRAGGVRAAALAGGIALLGVMASVASAQTSRSEPPPDPGTSTFPPQLSLQSQRYWYGWEVALVGETGGGLLSVALATHNVPSLLPWRSLLFFPVGIPTYVLGGPLVHWSNDNFDKGLISLGMNVTTPVVVGLIGGAVACSRSNADPSCRTNGFYDSVAVAVLIVPLIDAAFLAWGETVTERTITTSAVPWREVRPFFQFRESGQTLVGVAGRF